MSTYIMIENHPWPTDTDEEIQAAREALRDAEIESAQVYVTSADDLESEGDSYPNGQVLFPDDTAEAQIEALYSAEEWVVVHTPTGEGSDPTTLPAALATARRLGQYQAVHHVSALAFSPYRGYYATTTGPRYGSDSSEIMRVVADLIRGNSTVPPIALVLAEIGARR